MSLLFPNAQTMNARPMVYVHSFVPTHGGMAMLHCGGRPCQQLLSLMWSNFTDQDQRVAAIPDRYSVTNETSTFSKQVVYHYLQNYFSGI